MNRLRLYGASLLFVALAAAPLAAAPGDVVRTRINGFRELGAAFKSVNDGLRASEPQTILIQQSARQIRNAASAMPGWFPRGSGPEAGVKTAAKAEIWTQAPKFKTAQTAFITAASRFDAAVNSRDIAAMRMSSRALGATCKGCHDSFRVPSS